jgi:hypothetical protein
MAVSSTPVRGPIVAFFATAPGYRSKNLYKFSFSHSVYIVGEHNWSRAFGYSGN